MKAETQQLLTESKERLEAVLRQISRINGGNSYTDRVASAFYLGMVGGSGRNVRSLNKKRDGEISRTVANAVKLVPLYKERDHLQTLISRIESGEYESAIEQKKAKKIETNQKLVAYWNNLKAGDKISLGGNSYVTVVKKNKKSITSDGGCNWTAAEIIGKEASGLL